MNDIWTADMKSSEAMILAVRQLRTQFLQFRKQAWKFQDFNGVWTRDLALLVRALTNWAMKPLTLGAGHLWVPMFPWGMNQMKLWSSQLWTQFFLLRKEAWQIHLISYPQFIYDPFHISFHRWFIPYGNIGTHKWPAPNVSGFTAQLVRALHRYREVYGSNPVDVLNFSGFFTQLQKLRL